MGLQNVTSHEIGRGCHNRISIDIGSEILNHTYYLQFYTNIITKKLLKTSENCTILLESVQRAQLLYRTGAPKLLSVHFIMNILFMRKKLKASV